MIRFSSLVLAASLLTACGAQFVDPYADGGRPDARADAMSDGVTSDGPFTDGSVDVPRDVVRDTATFMTAPHEPFPQLPDQGGARMHNPQLVVVTYQDDPLRMDDVRYATWLMQSHWMQTVGAEYGVTGGTLLGTVELTENAPSAVTSTEIEAMITAHVADGTFPRPADGSLGEALYMVFYPATTTITMIAFGQSSVSCETFGGYHMTTRIENTNVAYAAIPTCPGAGPGLSEADYVQVAASHELIEAATDADPLNRPAFFFDENTSSGWIVLGGEVADLCANEYYTEENFPVTKVWSNAAAAAGQDPCLPSDPTGVYFNVSSSPDVIMTADPGETLQIPITGWSTGPIADWTIDVTAYGPANANAGLSARRINNGGTATLSVTIPRSAQSGTYTGVYVYSFRNRNDYHLWPVTVVVN